MDNSSGSVVVGARQVLLRDVVLVANGDAAVLLDPATLERCSGDAEKLRASDKKVHDIGSAVQVCEDSALSETEARAAIFARIVSYMQGRAGVGGDIITLLVQMLNKGIVPLLPHAEFNHSEGPCVARALVGAGSCFFQGVSQPLADALTSAGLAPLAKLYGGEGQTVSLRSFAAVGVACLHAAAADNVLAIADCSAALSCETLKAHMHSFEAVHFDGCRAHRGQMMAAENLRVMLQGSKFVNGSDGEQESDAVRCVPQYHGPAREVCAMAVKTMGVELNSAEAGPLAVGAARIGPYHPQVVFSVTSALSNAVGVLSAGAMQRQHLVKRSSPAPLEDAPPVGDFGGLQNDLSTLSLGELASTLNSAILTLQQALVSELSTNLEYFNRYEMEAEAAKKEKEARAAERTQGAGGGAKGQDDKVAEGMSEEQRAKWEAKRKVKEEKAREKAKAKVDKASKPVSIGLGTGSQFFRQQILTMSNNSFDEAALTPLLDPWAVKDADLGAQTAQMLDAIKSGGARRKPRLPRGTRDFLPEQMRVREAAFTCIRNVFKRHGAVEIDTPVFELQETFKGKYGEDSKLIYDLADQGGEFLSLRYDLTVPFARYIALNRVGNIKRYHIAKVYRRDVPNATRGRFREFYQCDFDIAGSYGVMVADAEVLSVACEILSDLPIGQFEIKLNHRRLLDAILDICGCPAEKFRTICSAIDKLDKEPWEVVKREMVEEKGLAEAVADRIEGFVTLKGKPKELWRKLTEEKTFGAHPVANEAMDELRLLFEYMDAMGTLEFISFDLSLARGLHYYTGLIYEAVVVDGTTKVGSIAAGGRYDGLVGMFSPGETPCVGVSIGVERVFAVMEAKAGKLKKCSVSVYVASIGADLLVQRMKTARALWQKNISAEFSSEAKPIFKKQLDYALEAGIPFMVVIGEDELARGTMKVKDISNHTEEEVPIDDVVAKLLQLGCPTVQTEQQNLLADIEGGDANGAA